MELGNNAQLTITRIAPLLRRKKLSPVELTRFLLERIDRLQPSLNAFITITADGALHQARKAEREILKGCYRGPLHGIPLSIKDLFYTRGIRTTAGSKILGNFVPRRDAPVFERLMSAGAVLTGKTNLHEFAFGATNINPHYGPVRNPWDKSRISGGSSGGSAVSVVAGLSLASMGSDTGGSIRIPSAACGCVGLKPTYGLLPLDGVIPLAASLDHVGPICRCVEDAALLLSILSVPGGQKTARPGTGRLGSKLRAGVKGMRIGMPRSYFFDRLQNDIRSKVLEAISCLEDLGAEIEEVPLKGMNETAQLASEITLGEALAYHWKWMPKRLGDYGSDVGGRLDKGKNLPAATYLLAQEKRKAYSARIAGALQAVDLLVMPALPIAAPRLDEDEISVGRGRENVRLALLRLTRPANLCGFPAITVPCGFTRERLPVGLQLMGRRLDEAAVLRASYAYEQATPWHTYFPPDF